MIRSSQFFKFLSTDKNIRTEHVSLVQTFSKKNISLQTFSYDYTTSQFHYLVSHDLKFSRHTMEPLLIFVIQVHQDWLLFVNEMKKHDFPKTTLLLLEASMESHCKEILKYLSDVLREISIMVRCNGKMKNYLNNAAEIKIETFDIPKDVNTSCADFKSNMSVEKIEKWTTDHLFELNIVKVFRYIASTKKILFIKNCVIFF